ncbi:class I SAM-dependent methyltransferase [Sandaracinobacteroides saxicola]|uniref:Class I SAM-dependent methyltransferase n=1 Tax=Sandaracinobacteroides saxicola TaxID=2759707 RepID=A0A7G5IKL6_9SPHN|nr:class I SAM-dependent methyltransferase [Sandaracinobacteroides saxicola]QMW23908.1 class I SAM-dependent methyltransferase [Sandaracinobacteroides saxicola]
MTHPDIDLFRKIWKGGYYGGDPMHPINCREYGDLGLISVNNAVYRGLVLPNINPETVVVEIGPGRGAWTRGMLGAKFLYCLDVLSAEHNDFWAYVGEAAREKISYFEVSDASVSVVPDEAADFIFSFGAFCHIDPVLQNDYLKNLYRVAKPGAVGVIMFANFDKSNAALDNIGKLRAVPATLTGVNYSLRYNVGRLLSAWTKEGRQDKTDTTPRPGRFYHRDIDDFAAALETAGWNVIMPDVGLNHRDAIALFRKDR